ALQAQVIDGCVPPEHTFIVGPGNGCSRCPSSRYRIAIVIVALVTSCDHHAESEKKKGFYRFRSVGCCHLKLPHKYFRIDLYSSKVSGFMSPGQYWNSAIFLNSKMPAVSLQTAGITCRTADNRRCLCIKKSAYGARDPYPAYRWVLREAFPPPVPAGTYPGLYQKH